MDIALLTDLVPYNHEVLSLSTLHVLKIYTNKKFNQINLYINLIKINKNNFIRWLVIKT